MVSAGSSPNNVTANADTRPSQSQQLHEESALALALPAPSSSSEAFFRTNRRVTEDWFARIRPLLVANAADADLALLSGGASGLTISGSVQANNDDKKDNNSANVKTMTHMVALSSSVRCGAGA